MSKSNYAYNAARLGAVMEKWNELAQELEVLLADAIADLEAQRRNDPDRIDALTGEMEMQVERIRARWQALF